jgi:hypothetical protein
MIFGSISGVLRTKTQKSTVYQAEFYRGKEKNASLIDEPLDLPNNDIMR